MGDKSGGTSFTRWVSALRKRRLIYYTLFACEGVFPYILVK
jgi:hypothetical protein